MFSREIFAERLRGLLIERRCTQAVLAIAIGVSHPAISGYLSLKKQPSFENMMRIAKYFGVSLDYLVGWAEE